MKDSIVTRSDLDLPVHVEDRQTGKRIKLPNKPSKFLEAVREYGYVNLKMGQQEGSENILELVITSETSDLEDDVVLGIDADELDEFIENLQFMRKKLGGRKRTPS